MRRTLTASSARSCRAFSGSVPRTLWTSSSPSSRSDTRTARRRGDGRRSRRTVPLLTTPTVSGPSPPPRATTTRSPPPNEKKTNSHVPIRTPPRSRSRARTSRADTPSPPSASPRAPPYPSISPRRPDRDREGEAEAVDDARGARRKIYAVIRRLYDDVISYACVRACYASSGDLPPRRSASASTTPRVFTDASPFGSSYTVRTTEYRLRTRDVSASVSPRVASRI